MRRFHSPSVIAVPVIVLSLVLLAEAGAQAERPERRCQAVKNKIAGKYAACRQRSEAKLAATGETAKYTAALAKCAGKLDRAWQRAVDGATAAGATCRDAPLTALDFKSVIDGYSQSIGTALGGGGLAFCTADALATCNDDLTTCEDDRGTCQSDLGTCEGEFGTCQGDLGSCESDLGSCEGEFGTCQGDLGSCEGDLGSCQNDLGQCESSRTCGNGTIEGAEECEPSNLNGETCESQGFGYGRLRCTTGCRFDSGQCVESRFLDFGDGTVFDFQTELLWEKKVSPGGGPTDPQDVTNRYPWSTGSGCAFPGCPNGSVFTDFLGRLNNCTGQADDPSGGWNGGFAYGCGWRLPTFYELNTLVDCESFPDTCIDPIFGPTSPDCCYLSTSTDGSDPDRALGVQFSDGAGVSVQKVVAMLVRAVQGLNGSASAV